VIAQPKIDFLKRKSLVVTNLLLLKPKIDLLQLKQNFNNLKQKAFWSIFMDFFLGHFNYF